VAAKLQDSLAYPPRGLRAPRAAAYVGMSETSFLALVTEGKMPRPKRAKGMMIWDRLELDAAFEALTDEIGKLNLIDEYLKETKDE
jgi:predicted DNA-binding transcriptional regulator AlpA